MQKEESVHFWQAHEPIPSINATELFHVGPFTVANSTMFTFLAIFLFLIAIIYARKFKLIPNYFQHMCEIFYEGILGLLSQIVGNKEHAEKILPVAGTIFTYILLSNLLIMLPGISSFTFTSVINGVVGEPVSIFRGGTADFNTTFGLALAAVLFIQYVGVKENGALSHISHFIQLDSITKAFKGKKSLGHRVGEFGTGIIHFFVGLIEMIGEFAKVISLSLRLFGNMFAHEILTIIIMGSFAILVPVIWMGMGIIVGIVQAVVFTSLITVYYTLVLKKAH